MFELLPELNFRKLHAISQCWSALNRNELFHDLQQALQKAQWAKHSGLSAINIDATLTSAFDPEYYISDPAAHLLHEKSLVECIIYCKSALDSLARFLRMYLNFKFPLINCDLKDPKFIKKLHENGEQISSTIMFEPWSDWFDSSRRDVNSIFPTRDKWIHNGIPNAFLTTPPINGRMFQIPFALDDEPMREKKYEPSKYISTKILVNYHVGNTLNLINSVIRNVYRNERRLAPNICLTIEREAVSFFPMAINEIMGEKGMKVGPFTAAMYGAVK